MTAKLPTRESFKISRRRARSRQERTASVTSMKPSRWMKPVTTKGYAPSTAPCTSAGSARYRQSHARSAQIAPVSSPTTGRNRSILSRASSSHTRQKHGIAQNMLRHMARACRYLFQNGSTPLWTMRRPAASSTTVSHSRASIRSIPASARRYCSVMGSYSPASEKI